MTDDSKRYCDYMLSQQSGCELTAFRGQAPYQNGNGLGDAMRSAFRFVSPILTRTICNVLAHVGDKINAGKSLKEAVSGGVNVAAEGALQGLGDTLLARRQQRGGRKRRSGSKKRVYKKPAALKKAHVTGLPLSNNYNF